MQFDSELETYMKITKNPIRRKCWNTYKFLIYEGEELVLYDTNSRKVLNERFDTDWLENELPKDDWEKMEGIEYV